MALCLWGILTISPIRVPVINLLSAMITEVEAEDRIHNMIIAWFELKIKETAFFHVAITAFFHVAIYTVYIVVRVKKNHKI